MDGRTQGEQKFIDQYTRKFMVEWSRNQVAGHPTPVVSTNNNKVYVTSVVSKGWLAKDLSKVTSKGFGIAASFLK